jgi:hypothetical protein
MNPSSKGKGNEASEEGRRGEMPCPRAATINHALVEANDTLRVGRGLAERMIKMIQDLTRKTTPWDHRSTPTLS